MGHKVTLVPGDGVGPELSAQMVRCVDATGVLIDWEEVQAGTDVMEKEGTPLPDSVLDSIRKNKVAIKGPITTPIGKGMRSVNVGLRHALDLFACVRPCRLYPGVRTHYNQVDLVIVRENSEDLYAGIEYDKGTDEVKELISWVNKNSPKKILEDSAISLKPISVTGTAVGATFVAVPGVSDRYRRSPLPTVSSSSILTLSRCPRFRLKLAPAATSESVDPQMTG